MSVIPAKFSMQIITTNKKADINIIRMSAGDVSMLLHDGAGLH